MRNFLITVQCAMALCVLPLQAMEHGQRSQAVQQQNHNEQPLSTAVKVLEVTGNFLSLLESVVGNLQGQDKLKVATLQAILDAANSPWKSGSVYTIEKVLGVTPDFAIPYVERIAGACSEQGPDFIRFLVGQKKEKKSLSDLLRAVRHGARYLDPNRESFNQFLSTHEATINTGLKDYHALVPALAAGVRAMHGSLVSKTAEPIVQSEMAISEQSSLEYGEQSLWGELKFIRRLLRSMQPSQELADDNDAENDVHDVCAEYERIRRELRSKSFEEDDVFYDARDAVAVTYPTMKDGLISRRNCEPVHEPVAIDREKSGILSRRTIERDDQAGLKMIGDMGSTAPGLRVIQGPLNRVY